MGSEPPDIAVADVNNRPLALVVFLENVGHISGLALPAWVMRVIDFVTEEYAKFLLHLHGAYRRYDRIYILEDARANGDELAATLLDASVHHKVDVLLLVHGLAGQLVGHRGEKLVGAEIFVPLMQRHQADPTHLNLRAVYGLNCYGASLASTWLALGAEVTNGAVGVNWFPEPSLSVFLRLWLGGHMFSEAVLRSNLAANRWWRRILRSGRSGVTHPWIESSRQVIFGRRDVSIDGEGMRDA